MEQALSREIKVVAAREEPNIYNDAMLPARIDSPELIFALWRALIPRCTWYQEEKEHLVCFCLDTQLKLKSFNLITLGTLNESIAHAREVFRPAIVDAAYGVVVV